MHALLTQAKLVGRGNILGNREGAGRSVFETPRIYNTLGYAFNLPAMP